MNYLYVIAGDIVNLMSTVLEGLNHIKLRMEEGQLKETLFLFEDVLEALISIENSIKPLLEEEKELETLLSNLVNSKERLALAYEEDSLTKALAEVKENLLPGMEKLSSELGKSLKKYKES